MAAEGFKAESYEVSPDKLQITFAATDEMGLRAPPTAALSTPGRGVQLEQVGQPTFARSLIYDA